MLPDHQRLDALFRRDHFLDRDTRVQLDHEQMLRSPKFADHLKVNVTRADRLVVVALRAHVVQMEAEEARCQIGRASCRERV